VYRKGTYSTGDEMLKTQVIRDVHGDVLYSQVANSIPELIQQLVSQGYSLADADLSHMNLSHLNLEGADLEGACLDNSSLNGTNLEKANLHEASLRRCNMHAARLRNARCEAADFTEADLYGAYANSTNFKSACFHDAKLNKLRGRRAIFTHAVANKAEFNEAELINADFRNATLMRCQFKGAKLRIEASIHSDHLPNRTAHATVVACEYDKSTDIEKKGMNAFRRDRIFTKFANVLMSGVSTVAVFGAAMETIPHTLISEHLLEHTVGHLIGGGVGMIAVIGVGLLVRETMLDVTKEMVKENLFALQKKAREVWTKMEHTVGNINNMVCAIGHAKSLAPIRKALASMRDTARERGFFSAVKQFFSDEIGSFIMCDQRHLALALATLSENRRAGYHISKEMVLVRHEDPENDDHSIPTAVRFHVDGYTSVVWSRDGEPSHIILYNDEGEPDAYFDFDTGTASCDVSHLPNARDVWEATIAFEQKVLHQNGLPEFTYPRRTHNVLPGRDGTIMVVREDNQNFDNPRGPAVIKPDGERMYFTNGTKGSETSNKRRQMKERQTDDLAAFREDRQQPKSLYDTGSMEMELAMPSIMPGQVDEAPVEAMQIDEDQDRTFKM
jgi:hypothetical protein